MKKFKFSLQVLLDVRIREEKSIKGQLYVAQNELNQLEQSLFSLEEKSDIFNEDLKLVVKNGITINKLQEYYSYLSKLKENIKIQQSNVEKSKIKCENIRTKLVEVSKAIKMLDTLKEQKYNAYLKELELDEGKVMDDYINSRVINK